MGRAEKKLRPALPPLSFADLGYLRALAAVRDRVGRVVTLAEVVSEVKRSAPGTCRALRRLVDLEVAAQPFARGPYDITELGREAIS